MEYELIKWSTSNIKYFVEMVNEYLANGWELHGDTFVVIGDVYQAMIRRNNE